MSDQEKTWQRDLRQARNASMQNNPPPEEDVAAELEPEEMEPEEYLPGMPEPLERNLDNDIIKEDPKSPQAEAAKMRQRIVEKIRSKTARLLFSSWTQIIASGGLAFWAWFYIGFHYMMCSFGGPLKNFFPKPGREWVKPFIDKAPLPEKFKKWTEETLGGIVGFFELMFASCCCGSCLIVLLTIIFFIWVFTNPCTTMKQLLPTAHSIAKFFGICGD